MCMIEFVMELNMCTTFQADGISGLQKGLMASLGYQVVVNGIRFELYMRVINSGIITNDDGSVSSLGCIVAGAVSGAAGGFVGNPFYLVSYVKNCTYV